MRLENDLRALREQRERDNAAHEEYKQRVEQEMNNANSTHELRALREAKVAIAERDSVQEQTRANAQETARQQAAAAQELENLRTTNTAQLDEARAISEYAPATGP